MTDFDTSDRDVNRAIRSWLHEDRHEDVSRIAGTVLDQLDTTRQRRTRWWPARRTESMNKIVAFGVSAAAVVAVVLIGAQVIGSTGGGVGAGPSPSASATAGPTPTPKPAPSSAASAPPLTQSFTSKQHGISVSYPEGWTTDAATGPWTDRTFPLNFGEPHADWLSDPVLMSDLFLTIASQPIGDSTPEDWVAAQMASNEGCDSTKPTAVDSATGLIGIGCDIAVVTTAGRGYWIQLYTGGDDPIAVAPYDGAWFEKVLATVRLRPGDAVDARPSPSP